MAFGQGCSFNLWMVAVVIVFQYGEPAVAFQWAIAVQQHIVVQVNGIPVHAQRRRGNYLHLRFGNDLYHIGIALAALCQSVFNAVFQFVGTCIIVFRWCSKLHPVTLSAYRIFKQQAVGIYSAGRFQHLPGYPNADAGLRTNDAVGQRRFARILAICALLQLYHWSSVDALSCAVYIQTSVRIAERHVYAVLTEIAILKCGVIQFGGAVNKLIGRKAVNHVVARSSGSCPHADVFTRFGVYKRIQRNIPKSKTLALQRLGIPPHSGQGVYAKSHGIQIFTGMAALGYLGKQFIIIKHRGATGSVVVARGYPVIYI